MECDTVKRRKKISVSIFFPPLNAMKANYSRKFELQLLTGRGSHFSSPHNCAQVRRECVSSMNEWNKELCVRIRRFVNHKINFIVISRIQIDPFNEQAACRFVCFIFFRHKQEISDSLIGAGVRCCSLVSQFEREMPAVWSWLARGGLMWIVDTINHCATGQPLKLLVFKLTLSASKYFFYFLSLSQLLSEKLSFLFYARREKNTAV